MSGILEIAVEEVAAELALDVENVSLDDECEVEAWVVLVVATRELVGVTGLDESEA
ncbi:MAG: hypothetical protein JRN58_03085 [Nitrososphaerota archaeon]|jgi:hypothetical protein|nr:hypothetical protein [Nitrososphaerota archaeon]